MSDTENKDTTLAKAELMPDKPPKQRTVSFIEPSEDELKKNDTGAMLPLILKSLRDYEGQRVERMSFEVDPRRRYLGSQTLYRAKNNLTPDWIIKRITGPQGDELVSQILQARSNHAFSLGRERVDRFSMGFDIVNMDKNAVLTDEQEVEIKERITKAKKIIWECGHGKLDDDDNKFNNAQLFKMITRDGISYGRFAVERMWAKDVKTGKDYLYAWRPSDSGTIYNILPDKDRDSSTRAEAISLLQQLKNKKIDKDKYIKDEDYKYVQVIEGKPEQIFTAKEMVVHNMYPTTNIEYDGYPLTPIDMSLNSIMTHINITMHNKLYFQNGRAAKGAWVFSGDAGDEAQMQQIRLQMKQSINGVQNSWRTPFFTIGEDESLTFQSIETSGRDAEFTFLSDNVTRVVLGAFQMSPAELPGYNHLDKGTNSQALSESNSEWKLTAARDVGLRPLIYELQDFINTHIFPYIDAELAKTHRFVISWEHDDPEKEATRLTQDAQLHLSMNDILKKVEKNPIPKALGGDLILNPQYLTAISQFLTVGQILESFFGIKGASADPRYQYIRDPFYFQKVQMDLQKAQIAMQQQMMMQQQMQQQAMMQQQAAMGIDPNEQQQQEEGGEEVAKAEVVNYELLAKKIESNHNVISQHLLDKHSDMVSNHMKKWRAASKKALKKLKDDDESDK